MSALVHVGHLLAFGAGFGAVATTSLIGVRALDVTGPVRMVLAWALLTCAQMVAAVEVLSLVRAVTLPGLLTLHVGVAALLLALGARPAKPSLGAAGRALWRSADDGLLRLLLVACLTASVLLLFLALYVPPNNHDSMTYHMTRVAMYLQQGSLDAFTTPDLRQTVLPANAEILILWTAVLLRHDTAANLVQWGSWVASIVAVFGLARLLGFAAGRSLFAALAFGAFPAVVLQATSTQNDLVMAFFVLCAFLFAGTEARGRKGGTHTLAAVAMGLAVGTKPLALLLVPGLAAFVAASWAWNRGLREAARLALLGMAALALLGSYTYVQNLRRFGRPTGPAAFSDLVSLPRHDAHVLWSNAGRFGLRFLDPGGVVPPGTRAASVLEAMYDRTTRAAFRHLGLSRRLPAVDVMKVGWTDFPRLPTHEDVATFGPLFGLAGVPLLVLVALRPRSSGAARALAAASGSYLLAVAVLFRYHQATSRYLISGVALGAPLLAMLYGARGRPVRRIANGVCVGVTLATLATCVLYNVRKPLVGAAAVWRMSDRAQRAALGRPDLDMLLQVLQRLPPGVLGVVPEGPEGFIYPLFGEHFERRVRIVHAGPLDPLSAEQLPRTDYLLVSGERQIFLVAGAPLPTEWPWFDSRDLRPLLADLRREGSPWHPVLDGETMGLFASRPVDVAHAVAPIDSFPLQPPPWGDGWAPRRFRMAVRLDAARSALVVEGVLAPEGGPTVIEVAGPQGEVLARESRRPGPIVLRVPLDSLVARNGAARFAALEFRAGTSFNPSRLGYSGDDRDLSWRLRRLRLESTSDHEVDRRPPAALP